MANTRITDLTASGAIADGDLLPIVDVSDTAQSSAGSTRKITKANLTTDLAPKASPTFTGTVTVSGLTASEIVITDGSKGLASAPVATYPSLTELSYVKGLSSAIQTQLGTKAPSTAPTFATSITTDYLTVSEIVISDASQKIVSAPVATYPSLTELSYVKGVTSAIQTQIGTLLLKAGGTMSGDITLGENTAVALDPAGSADEKWSGITCSGTAGATLAVGDIIYLDVTATEWLLADASAVGTAGNVPLGLCILAANDGQATNILLIGTVRSAAFPASIALGAPVYVSETAGDITATAPVTTDSVMRRVGWAITAEPNTIYFNPSNDYITHI